jgi:class 3 adenylate cyclase
MYLLFNTCDGNFQGTAELALRIGLNSGSTTAGVLRGEKSRFQLFGDVSFTETRCELHCVAHAGLLTSALPRLTLDGQHGCENGKQWGTQ